MIKIGFKKPQKAEGKYLNKIKAKVIVRLKVLLKTLDDLDGPATRVKGDNILSYKVSTRELINHVTNPAITAASFNAPLYIKTVNNYVADPNNRLGDYNLTGLRNLIESLLDQNTTALDDLLLCPPANLATMNAQLLAAHNLDTNNNKFAIKLAFDYEGFGEISDAIKAFFRKENIVLYCPYCNMLEADYSENNNGDASTIHFLDHFYDKAKNPLLSYSMYNLVPCDGICNGSTIKHDTLFEYQYHLSPYERGFDQQMMVFEAIVGKVGGPLKKINLRIIPAYGSLEYTRLIGDNRKISESSKRGNINVFNHQSRYNRPQVRKQNGPTMRRLEAHITNRNSLRSFLKDMGLQHNMRNYKKWYFDEFQVEFDAVKFHQNPYSKLIRDFHDKIVMTSDAKNADLKTFITNNPG